jgi:hypothetical protein
LRGSRPPAIRDNRHDSAYLFGAICPDRAVGAAIIMPGVNSEAMAEHLRELSGQVSRRAHAVLVCDGPDGTNLANVCQSPKTSPCCRYPATHQN